MPRNLWPRIALVVLVALGSVWYLYPPKETINLGLDLQGGIHLVLGVETSKALGAQIDRVAEDLRAAFDRKGIAVIIKLDRIMSLGGQVVQKQE